MYFLFQKEICKFLLQTTGDGGSLTPENAYYITTTWKSLKVCQALPVAAIAKVLNMKESEFFN